MSKTNILIIGSGGREHALGWKLKQSSKINKIFFCPGNAGTSEIGENIAADITNNSEIVNLAKKNKIELVVIGPDDPLANGMVDKLTDAGIYAFGPTKKAAKIEWSKTFAKNLMIKAGIPTAKFATFTNYKKAIQYIEKQTLPVVIKADGLTLGKGVIIAKTIKEANAALKKIMVDRIFGEAGSSVVIEEFLTGQEVSIHALCDGKNAILFPGSQDHKPIFDADRGPNTGGMGTISPLPWVTETMMKQIKKIIIMPTLKIMLKNKTPFKGCLYPGIMITADGPKILEFNARFGDPEVQSYMRLLKTDLFDVLMACINGTLDKQNIVWHKKSACCIAIASGGYPLTSKKGDVISGIESAQKQKDIVVFHAATAKKNNRLVTNGGRILGVTSTGKNLTTALRNAYRAVKKIKFDGMQYRNDIGQRKAPEFKKFKAIIFDKDGVIVDSEPLQFAAFKETLAMYGHIYNEEDHINYVLGKAATAYYKLEEKYSIPDIEEFKTKRRSLYFEKSAKNLKLRHGVDALIKKLHRKGYLLAVASGSNPKSLISELDKFKLSKYFKVVISGDKMKSKPDPEIFLLTAKKLGASPNECLVIEDSQAGVEAAKAAGMGCIAIPHSFSKFQDLSKADKIINSFSEIQL